MQPLRVLPPIMDGASLGNPNGLEVFSRFERQNVDREVKAEIARGDTKPRKRDVVLHSTVLRASSLV